jgi:hypothetical protein
LARHASGGQDFCGSQQGQSEELDLPIIFSQSVMSAMPDMPDMSERAGVPALKSVAPCSAKRVPATAAPRGAVATASATSRTTMWRRKDN